MTNRDDLNLGDVWLTNNFECELELQNRSTKPCKISELVPSCDCVTSNIQNPIVVQPDQSVNIPVRIDFSGLAKHACLKPREFEFRILIRDDLPSNDTVVLVTGLLRSALILDAQSFYLGNHVVRGSDVSEIVKVESRKPVKKLTLDFNGEKMRAEAIQIDELNFEVRFALKPDCPTGAIDEVIGIQTTTDTVAVPIRVTGRVIPEINASPEQLNLGICEVGEIVDAEFVLGSAQSDEFEMTKWEWLNSDTDSQNMNLELKASQMEKGSKKVKLRIRATTQGVHRDVLKLFVTKDSDQLVVEVPIALTAISQ